MKIEFNKVTWYSKLAAVILFLFVVPFLSFYFGEQYGELNMESSTSAGSTATSQIFNSTPQVLNLSASDNNKMITVNSNMNIEITLPDTAGYTFNTPQFNASLLKLNGTSHNAPDTTTPGDLGTDDWQFTALQSGVTDVMITAAPTGKAGEDQNIFKASFGIR